MKRVLFLILVFIFALSSLPAQAGPGDLEIYHLAVGQADSTLVRGPEDPPGSGVRKTLLVDAGNEWNDSDVLALASSLGVARIDYAIATHYHADHIGGIDGVFASLGQPAICFDRAGSYHGQDWDEYLGATSGCRRTIALGDMAAQGLDLGGGVTATCVCRDGYIIGGGYVSPQEDENARSIGIVISLGDFDEIISGDLTEAVEPTLGAALANPANGIAPIDVYQVNHHGSHNSSHAGFLANILPEVSVSSTGNTGDQLPKCEAYDRICAAGSTIYQTNEGYPSFPACPEPLPGCGDLVDGMVKVFTDGVDYTVTNGTGGWDTYVCDTATFENHTIYEIQDEAHPLHPPLGTLVMVEDVIVTGVVLGTGSYQYFVEEPGGGAWSGLLVFDPGKLAPVDLAVGDRLTVAGRMDDYFGMTEIEANMVQRTAVGQEVPLPEIVASADIGTGGALAEDYEGVLVRVLDPVVTDTNPDAPSDFGEFEVDGVLRVDDMFTLYEPTPGETFLCMTGPLNYAYSHFKLEPRGAYDFGDDCMDLDGDGYLDEAYGGADCDDTDPAVNPGAPEVCDNGVDDDCDGLADGLDPDCFPPFTLALDASYTGGELSLTYTLGSPAPSLWANYIILLSPTLQVIPLWSTGLPAIDPPIEVPIAFPFPATGMTGIYTGLFSAGAPQVAELVWVDTGS